MLACSRFSVVGDEQKKEEASKRKNKGTEAGSPHSSPVFPLMFSLAHTIEKRKKDILIHSSSKAFGYNSWEGYPHLKSKGILFGKFELNP